MREAGLLATKFAKPGQLLLRQEEMGDVFQTIGRQVLGNRNQEASGDVFQSIGP
jgi:hypothetical protein